ncbi:ATP-binding protein [Streptomyces umbrinus]|uniref:ATP-binding protein n=1 Tax=Streptomyces umbrinus TaxID=67370 RepID=UPI0033DE650A
MHKGTRPALTMNEKEDGTVVLLCHACGKGRTGDIVKAVGLTWADLFPGDADGEPQPGEVPEWAQRPYGAQRYEYRDADGTHLRTVVRRDPKGFHQEAPDGSRSVAGIPDVLFNLPAVRKAVEAGGTVHVAEGEKDVHAFHRSGLTATCNAGGAGKWRDEYADSLKGAAEVIVWPDKDDTGRRHAADVVKSLEARGIPYRLVEARTGKDPYDHLAAGWRVDQALQVEKPTDPVRTMRAKLLDRQALKRLRPPEYLIKGWLNKRSSARMNGDPASGKSLHLLDMAGCVGAGIPWHECETRKGTVVYVIAEGVEGFIKRVAAWERQYDREMEGVLFYPEPLQILGRERGELSESEEWAVFRELCRELRPDLVILDTQRRVTLAAEENSPSDLQKAVGALDALKRETGCTWFLGHHTPKNGHGGSGGGSMWGSVDTELETSKKGRGLEARFCLVNTKQKDGVDGERMNFTLAVHDVTGEFPGPVGVDPWADPVTSVVLVPHEREEADRANEVDLTLPDGINAKEAMRTLLRRVWGNGGVFTKAEARSLIVTKADALALPTFYARWRDLVAEGFIRAELSESGKELSRFRLDTSSSG